MTAIKNKNKYSIIERHIDGKKQTVESLVEELYGIPQLKGYRKDAIEDTIRTLRYDGVPKVDIQYDGDQVITSYLEEELTKLSSAEIVDGWKLHIDDRMGTINVGKSEQCVFCTPFWEGKESVSAENYDYDYQKKYPVKFPANMKEADKFLYEYRFEILPKVIKDYLKKIEPNEGDQVVLHLLEYRDDEVSCFQVEQKITCYFGKTIESKRINYPVLFKKVGAKTSLSYNPFCAWKLYKNDMLVMENPVVSNIIEGKYTDEELERIRKSRTELQIRT